MTISTFYPPDNNNDASIRAPESTGQSWDFVRDHAGSELADGTAGGGLVVFIGWAVNGATGWDRFWRTILIFDTSSLPDGEDINSAYLGIWWDETESSNGVYGAASGWTDAQQSIVVTAGSTASDDEVAVGDYDAIKGAAKWTAHFNATKDTNADPSVSGGWSDAGYAEHDLNATGVSGISKTGVTKLAIQCVADVDDDEPSVSGTSQTHVLMQGRSVNNSPDTYDPKLVINHGSLFTPSIRFF